MAKATKKSFSKKSRSMRRKTMGGKRKNKSSKAQRRMKKMLGGAPISGSGIVIDKDTLTVEWGEYPFGLSPNFYGQSDDVQGTELNFHIATSDGGNKDVINRFLGKEPVKDQQWSTRIGDTFYNLTFLEKVFPLPSEKKKNVTFVFKINSKIEPPAPSP